MISYLKKNVPKDLFYHGVHHTIEVLENAIEIAKAEKISETDLKLLKMAVLFHDSGFSKTYTGHEEKSCELARKMLPKFNATPQEIEIICGMIEATIIPQTPKTLLEKIIADADLMYFGTNRFIEIGNTLFRELSVYFNLTSQQKWNELQKAFLEKHYFHTNYCRKKYEPAKQKNLKKIIKALEGKG